MLYCLFFAFSPLLGARCFRCLIDAFHLPLSSCFAYAAFLSFAAPIWRIAYFLLDAVRCLLCYALLFAAVHALCFSCRRAAAHYFRHAVYAMPLSAMLRRERLACYHIRYLRQHKAMLFALRMLLPTPDIFAYYADARAAHAFADVYVDAGFLRLLRRLIFAPRCCRRIYIFAAAAADDIIAAAILFISPLTFAASQPFRHYFCHSLFAVRFLPRLCFRYAAIA